MDGEPRARRLMDTTNELRAARRSAPSCEPGAPAGLRPLRSASSLGPRDEASAAMATLARHRTLALQQRLRDAGEALEEAEDEKEGDDLYPPGSPLVRRGFAPVRSTSDPCLAARFGSPTAGGRLPRPTSCLRPPPDFVGRPPSPRGVAAPPPGAELLGACCGQGLDHKPRTFTLVDWADMWGKQAQSAISYVASQAFAFSPPPAGGEKAVSG